MSWSPLPLPAPPGPTLVEAVQRRDANRVGALLAPGADPNADRSQALCVAAADGSVLLLHLLLDAGSDANARGGLPLVLAVDGGHVEAASLLLERGSAPDALDGEAICLATHFARQDIVELLLLHGVAPAQGPPATLSSDPMLSDSVHDDEKENLDPMHAS
jgi:ankyrin repeat protein